MNDRTYQNMLDGLTEAARDLSLSGFDDAFIYRAWNATVDRLEAKCPGFQAWLGDRVVEF